LSEPSNLDVPAAGLAVQRERPDNKSGLFTHGTENAAPTH
jgi:hypothetical protein